MPASSFLEQYNFIMIWKGQNLNFSGLLGIHPEHSGMEADSSWFSSSFPILLPPCSLSCITGASYASLWMIQPMWPNFISLPTHPSTVPPPCLGRMDQGTDLYRPWNWAWVPMGREVYSLGNHCMIKGYNLQGPPLL